MQRELLCDEMSPVDDRARSGALIHAAAIATLSWFVLTVALEHVLVPELTPARHTISEYANARGAAGPVMVVGFLMWAASLGMTAVLLRRHPVQGRGVVTRVLRNALFGLLIIAAVGAIATALFPTQTNAGVIAPGHVGSNGGGLHGLASGLIRLCFYPAVVLSIIIIPTPRWFRSTAVTLLLIAAAVGPALAMLDLDAAGARQRVQLASGCGWQLALLAAWVSVAPDRLLK